ncbi:MAG TPA: DEAD/DEAH box helicase, partial [Thermoanaerobaculia bacterium]
ALARRSVGSRLLLVTATPVCNSARDLEALLRLIATDDALLWRGVPSIDLAFERRDRDSIDIVARELLLRRDRSVLPPSLAFGDLDRHIIWSRNGDDEVDRLIAELRFPLVAGEPLVRDFLRRRLDSSEAALLESLRRQRRFYERALECLASGRALPKREYRRAFGHEEDAAAVQTILFWELFVDANAGVDAGAIHDALASLDELAAAVDKLPRAKEGTLVELCRETTEPMIIFTGWTATARALASALQPVKRVLVVTGRERTNEISIDAFRRGYGDVLISTDVGAEGLNLQRAGVIVHYDLPWNPVKVDQRNGRAHRIGQTRESVRAIYFLADRHRDDVFQKIATKNRVRRRLVKASDPLEDEAHVPTIRPRVATGAAVIAFAAQLHAAGWRLPEPLARRHRAGVELLLAEIARNPIDAKVLRDLEAVLASEPWAVSRGVRFTLL